MRKALERMVRAAEKAKSMDEGLMAKGYSTNPYGDIFGEIADAIFYLLNEKTCRFEDSLTYIALNTDAITEESKVEILMMQYKKNQPALF